MGFLTGVLVLNDEVHNLRDNPKLGEDLFHAVCGWGARDREPFMINIGRHQSRVVCQAHADYPQIVMFWKNAAYSFGDPYDKHADDVIEFAIRHLQDIKRYRDKQKATPTPQGSILDDWEGKMKQDKYERQTIAGIEMDVMKAETLFFARSPRWKGFMVTGRTMEQLAEKLPDALREYEEVVAGSDRDQEVLKAFAKLRSEEEACALKNITFNHDPERAITLQAVRALCATLWPHHFASETEMAAFNAKWDALTQQMIREMEAEEKA